eukprot:3690134-Pyramimonas_sp.AAC.1
MANLSKKRGSQGRRVFFDSGIPKLKMGGVPSVDIETTSFAIHTIQGRAFGDRSLLFDRLRQHGHEAKQAPGRESEGLLDPHEDA